MNRFLKSNNPVLLQDKPTACTRYHVLAKISMDSGVAFPPETAPLFVGPTHVARITKGYVNRVFIVATEKAKFIYRVNPDEEDPWRFIKEEWCYKTASAADIPSPQVFCHGSFAGSAFMVLSYLEGSDGDHHPSDIQNHMWRKLGEYAKKIHSFPFTGFGDRMKSPGCFGGFEDTWERYLEYNISSLTETDQLLSRNIISRDDSDFMKKVFLKLKDTKFKFGLIHNDLSMKNSVLGEDGKTVYLIDWGCAEIHVVPHMEFNEVLNNVKEDSQHFLAFLSGLEMTFEEYLAIKPEIKEIELLVSTDKVRWAIDCAPDCIDDQAKRLQAALSDLPK